MPAYVAGIDGKSYPRPIPAQERDLLIGRAHWLHHDEGASIREIRERFLYDYNVKRSVGTICAWLRVPCSECSGGQSGAPEQMVAR